MARSIPSGRVRRLLDVATDTFIALGYRRTQMADVAVALGVGKGTLYGYVESKEALFDAALRHADGYGETPDVGQLPLPTPPAGAAERYLAARLASEASGLVLAEVAQRPAPADVAEELRAVVDDLYARMGRNRRAIKLVDRCAVDRPELARVWFGAGRWAQHGLLVTYLQRRMAEGRLWPIASVPVAARFVLETVATWAVHRHWDPSPQPMEEDEVHQTVLAAVVRGLVKEQYDA